MRNTARKRLLSLALAVLLALSVIAPVIAEDTVIDWVLYTNVRAFINGVEISSYNIKGNTAVVVEDLAEYGFDVVWDGATATLSAAQNTAKEVTGTAVKKVSGGRSGERAMPVYATNIKTYFDGQLFESYNVGGRTIVYMDALAEKYAEEYEWDPGSSTLKMTISAHTHRFDAGTITKKATCTVDGIKTYTCLECGKTKTETIPALGHDLDNHICKRCGVYHGGINPAGKDDPARVEWIGEREIYYDSEKNAFRLQFALKDADYNELAVPATVDIKIVNKNNETVYSSEKTIAASDYGTWTWRSTGVRHLLATIYIRDSEITQGLSPKGTVYFTVTLSNGVYFENERQINQNLPVKPAKIILPTLPKTISDYWWDGRLWISCTVNNISYEISGDEVDFDFTITMTYNSEGTDYFCRVGWKLYDEDGIVVYSGTLYSNTMKVGESSRKSQSVWNKIKPGKTYRLELFNP